MAGTSDGVICVILCAASIEGFVNDLAEWFMYLANHNKDCESLKFYRGLVNDDKAKDFNLFQKRFVHCFHFAHMLSEVEQRAAFSMMDMEKGHKSVFHKISELYNILTGEKWDSGSKIHQEFNYLMDIRNSVAHMKGTTLVADISEGQEVSALKYSGHPDFIKHLVKRNIIGDRPSVATWVELIDDVRFCDWCLSVTRNLLDEIIKKLPDTATSNRFKENVSFS